MKKLLKIIGLLLLLLILITVLALGYLGFIPGLSSLLGSDRPRDLGVHHTEKDLQSAQVKLKQTFTDPTGDPFQQYKSAPGHKVDTTLTQEEYAAHIERIHPVSDVQVKLSGNSFEISGRVDKARIPQFVRTWGLTGTSDKEVLDTINKYYPGDPIFYIAGTGGAKNNTLDMNLTKAELGRLPVSTDQAKEALKIYTETLFKQVPGFSVEDSTIENGQLKFKGSAVSAVPKY